VPQDDYQPGTTWYRGDRLSDNYRGESHYVTNYRTHRLHRPGRNQRWVKVNEQYLLIGIATGIIIEAIINGN
jgi:Ni/Co efflux regulator RcnB